MNDDICYKIATIREKDDDNLAKRKKKKDKQHHTINNATSTRSMHKIGHHKWVKTPLIGLYTEKLVTTNDVLVLFF